MRSRKRGRERERWKVVREKEIVCVCVNRSSSIANRFFLTNSQQMAESQFSAVRDFWQISRFSNPI